MYGRGRWCRNLSMKIDGRVPSLRGGGEFGRAWYNAATLQLGMRMR